MFRIFDTVSHQNLSAKPKTLQETVISDFGLSMVGEDSFASKWQHHKTLAPSTADLSASAVLPTSIFVCFLGL